MTRSGASTTRADGVAPRLSLLLLSPRDNVAVALRPLKAGEQVQAGDRTFQVGEDLPFGHKVAIAAIGPGSPVIKYGEVIGRATSAISIGSHVHVHNVVSARLPGGGD